MAESKVNLVRQGFTFGNHLDWDNPVTREGDEADWLDPLLGLSPVYTEKWKRFSSHYFTLLKGTWINMLGT